MATKDKTMTTTSPIADKTLWDSLGNSCRVELHKIGRDEFELYLHNFNSDIPKRYVGGLGELNARADRWLEARKADGFVEQLPSYNPDAWRA